LRFALAFLACCLALSHEAARGAEIKATPVPGLLDTAMITLGGEIESSDAEQFRAAVATYPKAIVAFQSPGGSLIAGIEIGTQIRLRNYMTLVPTGVQCASACALAWLGGTKRLMGPGALVGFHAASVDENGQAIETGPGNALLGAYLNKLGLPDRAVVFVTQAHPNEITWLTMADAEREGIDVSLFPMQGEAPNTAPGSGANPTPSPPSQPPPTSSAPLPSIPVRWYEGLDAPGNDFGTWIFSVANAEDCMRLCVQDSACVGVTYNIKRSVCIRKSRIGSLIHARNAATTGLLTDRTPAPDIFAGPAPRVRQYENMDATGNDRGSWIRGVSRADCESICLADNGCAGYTYNRLKATCIPKNVVGRLISSSEPAMTGVVEGR
jgi:hypothetical protein